MITALDSNILSAIFSREPMALRLALALDAERADRELVISPIVYAELLAHPAVDEPYIVTFLSRSGVRIDFRFDDAVWTECGRRFAQYAARRRKSRGDEPKRFLADFFVGSHALHQADRLMTLDPKRYQQDFPEVKLVIPV